MKSNENHFSYDENGWKTNFIKRTNIFQENLSDFEKRAAAENFTKLVGDIYLQNSKGAVFRSDEYQPQINVDLSLRIDQSDGSILLVFVFINGESEIDYVYPREIGIHEFDKNLDDKGAHLYGLTPDKSEVRRSDFKLGKQPWTLIGGEKYSEAEIEFIISEHNFEVELEKERVKREEQMGLNCQPVSPEEITKLKKLLIGLTKSDQKQN